MSKQNRPALIVFGKRPRKHPRAAWFAAADAAVARWIAQQSGLSILKATARVINQLGNPVAEWQLVSARPADGPHREVGHLRGASGAGD